ncbi:hypothetical protein IPZ58_07670 [Streptomyces roseoverticillatus]|uniref:hypothetical protein n=1 Tax=Streptomyces roseoverticillatus TaxID=66429 RepID=UPI001F21D479|nr:hypothetical protein [Streptomyces roseoverticillatus]MCF3101458.1 hypothetical protein [Streptomyces roseoverticillatus]
MPGDPAPLCLCGHRRDKHNSPAATGGLQCRACPIDGAGQWRHLYTPDHETSSTGCYAPHCAADDILGRLHALVGELYVLASQCGRQCGAVQTADRILAALNTPENT